MAAGDYTNEEPRFPTDSDSDEEVVDANEDDEEDHESVSIHNLPNSTPSIIVPDDLNEEEQEDAFDSARTPIPTQSVHMIPHPPGLESALQPTDVGKLELEVAVFSEVIPDQITFPATKTTTLVSSRPETVLSSKFANSDVPRIHKSLVLNCRTTTLAEYFTMIDRELIAHFVMISEIVLTRPAKRHFVVAKFLKVAWKTALVLPRSPAEETQINKVRQGCNRQSIPTACIPLFGIYLAQLYKINKLPALIDATSPNQGVGIHLCHFRSAAHPEVFSAIAPLPPTMNLEPLINVHKQ
ncbi:hypothetical protein K443DRAFT_736 [Laccaria amethystina LaAM-08-1]|uniref:Uncharacterized protein n=1 Tax=Laccaria amethystina LaAM-08-1 TaxID=1095629 RepID=A0A0C9Y6L1_9AGAR|nr:hypothetical protein K443DRAFT_736 [Laccaria amethystina LaAM-08-1]